MKKLFLALGLVTLAACGGQPTTSDVNATGPVDNALANGSRPIELVLNRLSSEELAYTGKLSVAVVWQSTVWTFGGLINTACHPGGFDGAPLTTSRTFELADLDSRSFAVKVPVALNDACKQQLDAIVVYFTPKGAAVGPQGVKTLILSTADAAPFVQDQTVRFSASASDVGTLRIAANPDVVYGPQLRVNIR